MLQPGSVKQLYITEIEPTGFYRIGSDGSGLGHFIESFEGGDKAVFHGGEGTGALGKVYAMPEEGEGIVILTNSKRSWPFLLQLVGGWAQWNASLFSENVGNEAKPARMALGASCSLSEKILSH